MSAATEALRGLSDVALPTLPAALDPDTVLSELARLPRLSDAGPVELLAIRLIRHKPGRRAVVAYDLETGNGPMTAIGKIRARRYGKDGLRLQQAFWKAGLDGSGCDGIGVPEPLGRSGHLRMWLQRGVDGHEATELLGEGHGARLAPRIAATAHAVHRSGVAPQKVHAMDDEVRVLADCFPLVTRSQPSLERRVTRLLGLCRRLAATTESNGARPIHRDFYGDQIIIDGPRTWLLDLDLFCLGDPSLDIGNFVGHVTEQALRAHGSPTALDETEQAIEDRFVDLAGEQMRRGIRTYAALTVARHVYLSTVLSGRGHLTGALLDLAEERVTAEIRR
jgi:hypothetical protein